MDKLGKAIIESSAAMQRSPVVNALVERVINQQEEIDGLSAVVSSLKIRLETMEQAARTDTPQFEPDAPPERERPAGRRPTRNP